MTTPDRTFLQWTLSLRNQFAWIASIGSLVTVLVTTWGFYTDFAQTVEQGLRLKPGVLPFILQAIVIFVLSFAFPKRRIADNQFDSLSAKLKHGVKSSHQFRDSWARAWFCWGLLYVGLALQLQLKNDELFQWQFAMPWSFAVLNLLQNLTTVYLFRCYEVAVRPTIDNKLEPVYLMPPEGWGVILVAAFALEGVFIHVEALRPYAEAFSWLSGFGQGVAIALVIGRLESRFVASPLLLIGALYVYAVIQGAWAVVNHVHAMQSSSGSDDFLYLRTSLTLAALILKLLMFLFVSWLMSSPRLVYYLCRVSDLDKAVAPDWDNFRARFAGGSLTEDQSDALLLAPPRSRSHLHRQGCRDDDPYRGGQRLLMTGSSVACIWTTKVPVAGWT